MEESGGLPSMGSRRVGHDWATSLSLFYFHALEKEMATHSSVLAWRIPGTGEPGGLQSMGSHSRTRLKQLNSSSSKHSELPRWLSGKEFTCQWERYRRHWFDPWVGKIPWRKKWQPAPVFLPGKSHGQRRLAGYSLWCCEESDMFDWLNTQRSFLSHPKTE